MPTPSSTPSNSQTGSQYISPLSPPHAHRRPHPSSSSSSSTKKPAPSSSHNAQTQPPAVAASAASAASTRAATNIWQLMGYPIPRGPCRHKPGMLSSACTCLRFMLNPVVAGSTFCCDGCGHHASFHVLKGEYPTFEEGDGIVGMGVGDIIQSQHQQQQVHVHSHGHGHGTTGGTPVKGRGKRLMELEFDEADVVEEEVVEGEWVGDESGELMVVSRGFTSHGSSSNTSTAGSKRRIPGSFTNGPTLHRETSGNGIPSAKRSRV